jgi:hypothetical protein
MFKIGYMRCEYDCCVYVKSLDDGSFIFLLLYVDDMLIAAKSIVEVNKLNVLTSTILLLKIHFLVCIGLPVSGKLPLRTIWSAPMVPFSGTLFSPV